MLHNIQLLDSSSGNSSSLTADQTRAQMWPNGVRMETATITSAPLQLTVVAVPAKSPHIADSVRLWPTSDSVTCYPCSRINGRLLLLHAIAYSTVYIFLITDHGPLYSTRVTVMHRKMHLSPLIRFIWHILGYHLFSVFTRNIHHLYFMSDRRPVFVRKRDRRTDRRSTAVCMTRS